MNPSSSNPTHESCRSTAEQALDAVRSRKVVVQKVPACIYPDTNPRRSGYTCHETRVDRGRSLMQNLVRCQQRMLKLNRLRHDLCLFSLVVPITSTSAVIPIAAGLSLSMLGWGR